MVLLWIYYSAEIFLLGAEFTKVYAANHGSVHGRIAAASAGVAPGGSDARLRGTGTSEALAWSPLAAVVVAVALLPLLRNR